MVIDKIELQEKEIITTHIVTINDILLETNTFLVRISKSVKKIHEAGKRGRKKGGKNRPKAVIEPEKRQKKQEKGKIKKGSKNPFKDGQIHVYHYDRKEGLFHPKHDADGKVVDCFKGFHVHCFCYVALNIGL